MRIAIIGCGNMGERRIQALAALGHQSLMLYDSRFVRTAELYADRFPVAQTIKGIWDWKPEVVFVCTSPESHYGYTDMAVRLGAHVFIEKPLSLDAICWPETARLVAEKRLVTMVGCNWRFAAGPFLLKKWLTDGVLGEVYTARLYIGYSIDERKGYKRSYVAKTGAILDVGSHALDLALHWFGPGRLSSAVVRSARSIGLSKMDGAAEMLIDHGSGVTSSIHVNLLQRPYRHSAEITGREGIIGYDFGREHIYSRLWAKPYEDYYWQDSPDMFVQEMVHFLACVREGRQTRNPVSAAAETLRLLLEAKTWAGR